jgi:pimeloyl-ACP methyl ester carboxylesterase
MEMTTSILFLPGTGLPDQFYIPFLAILKQHGRVHHWRYRHHESILEAGRRLGGGGELFGTLRREVCFGPSNRQPAGAGLGIQPGDGISQWYEGLADGESNQELWQRTVVVGHSQGAGHALLLSQQRSLAGAVMIAGPADAWDGQPAPWTRQAFQTEPSRRLLMVHAQDAGCRAVLAHAETCGLTVRKDTEAWPEETGGIALVDTEAVGAFSAHGCLAGGQTWAGEGGRQERFRALLSRHFQRWRSP